MKELKGVNKPMYGKRKIIYLILCLMLILALILFVIIKYNNDQRLKVIFLDVGQGDAILIEQGANQMLIDGGKDGKLLLEKLGKYMPFWDRKIETVIESHPDQDHIGGLIEAAKTYQIGAVLKTNAQSDSQTFKTLEEKIKSNGVQDIGAKKDLNIKFANYAEAEILYPFISLPNKTTNDTNADSVVMKLIYGKNKFLFTGDLPSQQEQELIKNGEDLSVDILKVSHHGSRYATSNDFLDAIKTTDAIISVGKNNSYGHPNQETLQRLIAHRINILRTDEIGDIIFQCSNPDIKCQVASNY